MRTQWQKKYTLKSFELMQICLMDTVEDWRNQQHQSCPYRASSLESKILKPVANPLLFATINFETQVTGADVSVDKPSDPGLLIFLPCAALFGDKTTGKRRCANVFHSSQRKAASLLLLLYLFLNFLVSGSHRPERDTWLSILYF